MNKAAVILCKSGRLFLFYVEKRFICRKYLVNLEQKSLFYLLFQNKALLLHPQFGV